jgi:hypothetical protein
MDARVAWEAGAFANAVLAQDIGRYTLTAGRLVGRIGQQRQVAVHVGVDEARGDDLAARSYAPPTIGTVELPDRGKCGRR